MNKRGQPCEMPALEGSSHCFAHAPERAAERAKARKAGGQRNRTPSGEGKPVSLGSVADVLAELEFVYSETMVQANSAQRSRTAAVLLGVALKTLEVGELEGRLAAIEARLATPSGRRTA